MNEKEKVAIAVVLVIAAAIVCLSTQLKKRKLVKEDKEHATVNARFEKTRENTAKKYNEILVKMANANFHPTDPRFRYMCPEEWARNQEYIDRVDAQTEKYMANPSVRRETEKMLKELFEKSTQQASKSSSNQQ